MNLDTMTRDELLVLAEKHGVIIDTLADVEVIRSVLKNEFALRYLTSSPRSPTGGRIAIPFLNARVISIGKWVVLALGVIGVLAVLYSGYILISGWLYEILNQIPISYDGWVYGICFCGMFLLASTVITTIAYVLARRYHYL